MFGLGDAEDLEEALVAARELGGYVLQLEAGAAGELVESVDQVVRAVRRARHQRDQSLAEADRQVVDFRFELFGLAGEPVRTAAVVALRLRGVLVDDLDPGKRLLLLG